MRENLKYSWWERLWCTFLGHGDCICNIDIDAELMEAGYLCPDYRLHQYVELTVWMNDVRYMTCKNCGKTTLAMAKILPSKNV